MHGCLRTLNESRYFSIGENKQQNTPKKCKHRSEREALAVSRKITDGEP